jgi:hypothetical protein
MATADVSLLSLSLESAISKLQQEPNAASGVFLGNREQRDIQTSISTWTGLEEPGSCSSPAQAKCSTI